MGKLSSFLEKTHILVDVDENGAIRDAKSKMPTQTTPSTVSQVTAATGESSNEQITNKDIVEAAYSKLPKSDVDVFVVESLMQNFAMLPNEAKAELVLKTLATMGVDVSKLIADANARTKALSAEYEQACVSTQSKITARENAIKKAEEEISGWKKEILDAKNEMEGSKNSVTAELKRLADILQILGKEQK